MAKTRDYMDYLDEFVEISPANSEEEYQAAEVLSGILKDHALETTVESFDTHPAGTVMLPILMCIMFVSIVVMGLTEGSLHYGALVLGVLCAGLSVFTHFAGTNIFQNFGPASQSQNVVAVHRATGDKVVKGARPIVIVAHYDTPRESLLRRGPLARFQTSLPRVTTPLTIAVMVVVLLQAIPVLPGTIRTFLWVIGVLIALPVLFMAVVNIYDHFAPCTQGANDNKSSVAALLSIANRVRPGEDRVDRYVENGNESLLRRAGDKPVAPPEPKYVEIVEETKGVRHGPDVLLSLGILPPNCDVVYEEPRVTLVQEDVEVPSVDDVVADDMPLDDVVGDAIDQLDDVHVDEPVDAVDEETPDQVEPVEEAAAPEYLEVLADPEEEDYDESDESLDEEDYDEDEEEIYDDEELFAEDEAPNSLVDWIKERVAALREFFSRDRGSDMDIDRGKDRTVEADDELGEGDGEFDEEEIALDDEEQYDDDAAFDDDEYLEEEDEHVAARGLADKVPGFDDIDEDDVAYEELDEEQIEDDAFDVEDEDDADYAYDADYDQAESDDEDEEVYLEDLEPEPLEFEGEDDEYVEEDYEEEAPQSDEADSDEYVEEEEEEYDESEYEEYAEEDEEEDAEADDEAYEDVDPEDAEPEDDDSEDGWSEASESDEDEQEAYVYDDEDEYEYIEDDETEGDQYEEAADWDEDEAEEENAADMPTRIIGSDGYDEFDLDEEEYQEDYEGYEEYEDEEEVEEEEHAPTLVERLMGFFRGLRESQDQSAYDDEYDYDEEYEYEDDAQQSADTPEEDLAEEYVEEFEEDDLYGEEEVADEGYAAEDDDIEPYDEMEVESPLPDDLEQVERPADPNVLHLDDYDEDMDMLPRDTTGLDTISDSYDLFSNDLGRVPQRDKPEPVVDPSWGVTSYQPARPAMNIARRAALLDLPDPSEAFVDPLSYVGYGGFGYEEYEDDEYDEYTSYVEGAQDDSVAVSVEEAVVSQAANTVGEEQYYDESYMQLDELEDDSVDDYGLEFDEPEDEDDQGQQSFWGTNESSDWKGGATQRADLREEDGEPLIIDADSLQDAILELGDEYLVAHDIWFVATGASETDHAGIQAFMEAHKRDIRGAFLVNLDSIGAGALSILVREGLHVPKRADRRLVRMLTGIAQDLHIQIETAMLNWADRESTVSMRSRIRSVTIMGLDENDLPANSHTQDDVPELVNPRQVSSVVRIVTELIRRS